MKSVDRGEYRPIYVALLDGKDFQQLGSDERWVLVALKLSLGMLGIDVIPGLVAALADRTGHKARVVARALDRLEADGWIERERNVTWLVRGFAFEPSLAPSNSLHRTSVQRQIEALPSLGIVTRFREAYRQWFDVATPKPPETPMDTLSKPSLNTETETETVPEPETETNPPPDRARADLAGEPPAPAGSDVARLLVGMGRTVDRWAVFRFLERVPDTELAAWTARLAGYLEGLGFPAGMRPTPAQLATACSDYSGSFSPMHFRAFVLRVIEGPKPHVNNRGTSKAERNLETAKIWADRKRGSDAGL